MRHILAIDQSTSATKALLFNADAELIDSASREHRQHYPQPGWVEHDAEEIWQNTLAAVSELLARQPDKIAGIGFVSITNQRETALVFEKGTGKPLHPAIVWQCRRGDEFCRFQDREGRGAAIQAKTGLRLDSYFSGSKLQWLMRNRPDLRTKVERGEALIGTIDAYLVYRLTRGAMFATDHTNASRTLLYNIDQLNWDDELCSWWEIPRSALPEVLESSSFFGETDFDGRLPRQLPICGVMGDSQASLFAHRCFSPGEAKATFGSGTSVLLNVGRKRPQDNRGAVAALAWVHHGVATYALEGIITYSGATLTWLRDQLGLYRTHDELEALAAAAGDDHGVYLVPAFSGLSAPHWCESARAAIVGLTAHSDRRHIARAGLESIAYQLRDVVEMLEAESGVKLTRINADGGATTNRFLMQFTADITGVELRAACNYHYSPLGALLMGTIGMQWCGSVGTLPTSLREDPCFRPCMPEARAQSLRSGWQRAVRQVASPALH